MLSILCYQSVFQKLKLSHTTKCHEEGFTPVCVSQAVHTASATVTLASKACNDLKYSLGAEKLCFRATCSHCLIFIRRGLCACVFSPRNKGRDKCHRGLFGIQCFTAWSPINWADVVWGMGVWEREFPRTSRPSWTQNWVKPWQQQHTVEHSKRLGFKNGFSANLIRSYRWAESVSSGNELFASL